MDHSIGAAARLAGVSVKAVRHYSDLGLLTSRRTAAGHRRYDDTAVARLRLIRTLRALDLDLATIGAVLRDERSLADVAATHAEALAIQIQTLRRQHALLTVLARHPEPEDVDLMTEQSEQDRRAQIAEFLSATLRGVDRAIHQNVTPVLPEDADAAQLAAWAEITRLVSDEDFRRSVRRLSTGYQALAADDPLRADPAYRGRLIALRRAAGPRWERYLELVAVVNGWEAPSRIAG